PEAKPLIADNTDPCRVGNVGRCLVDHFLFNFLILQSLFYSTLYHTFLLIINFVNFTFLYIFICYLYSGFEALTINSMVLFYIQF
ncbi:MAG: hypothetical protein WC279_06535, partial [Sulfurimonas sp.]|uniref:hypothetical protein n=1 Tax=Sulfurimonas sp. TaxID=2022749 RepID=UPI00356722F7